MEEEGKKERQEKKRLRKYNNRTKLTQTTASTAVRNETGTRERSDLQTGNRFRKGGAALMTQDVFSLNVLYNSGAQTFFNNIPPPLKYLLATYPLTRAKHFW